ncbi:acyltransferase family protein [Gordonia sp. LSe1-13]|uniref:Acyltransferase family protein n=1 Tax=Gordonia sesuvii TaxID=3116777 RepID=A0ABU7MHM1_9ACTN|nr:acyltransferase family protein [Gordonia sp. LSe1-13]
MTSNSAPARRRTLPSVTDLDALTGDRDRVIDLIRLTSLVVVIAGHSVMLTVVVEPEGFVLGNLLADIPILQAVTWLLQVLPLFFFAGAAAATYGLSSRPTTSTGHWLLTRAQRLLRPVFWYLLAVAATALIAVALGADAAADVVARLGVQLLWFLGAYLLVLAVVPTLQRIATPRHVVGALGLAWGATAAVDVIRFATGWQGIGYVSFLTVWSIPAILGVAYAKRLVTPIAAASVAAVFFVLDIMLVAAGPYELSLVTVPGQELSNMSPPSLLLAGHAIVLCGIAIAAARMLASIVGRARVWWWVAVGNRGAMTLYLWHLPVLAFLIGAGELIGLSRDPGQHPVLFTVVVGTQTVVLLALMVPVVAALSPLENRELLWWDGPVGRNAGRARDRVVVAALVVTGVATLMMARDGLLGDGLVWAGLSVGGAVIARSVAVRSSP